MKKIYILTLILAALFISCVGQKEPSDSYNITIEATNIYLNISKGESARIKVKNWSEDITAQSQITYTLDGVEQTIEDGIFTPTKAGKYNFSARFDNQECHNTITVTAYDDNELSDKFLRRHLITKFTACWCVNCPVMGEVITEIEHERPFEIVEIAVHANDKHLAVPQGNELFTELGYQFLPTVVVDMATDKQIEDTNKAKIEEAIELSAMSNPTVAGVRISSKLTSNKLDIEVGVKSSVADDYKVVVALVADNFHFEQTGASSANYKQNKVLQQFITDKYGDAISDFKAGEDNIINYSTTLPATLPGECRVVAYVLSKQSDDTYRVNNSTECEAGYAIDYIYALK